jgi:hypothetical protein
MKDTRLVYGASCMWWDSIYEVGHIPLMNGMTLPCCPHCRNILFEMPDENMWWAGVDRYEASGHPGYRAMIEWSRGKCFPSLEATQKAYSERETS